MDGLVTVTDQRVDYGQVFWDMLVAGGHANRSRRGRLSNQAVTDQNTNLSLTMIDLFFYLWASIYHKSLRP
jgi:hypothetical protein